MPCPGLETICVRLLRSCDLHCSHCWSYSGPTENTKINLDKLIKFLDATLVHGLKHVSLSGGEPTMYPALYEVIQWCTKRHISVTITTNGFNTSRLTGLLNNIKKICLAIKKW